MLSIKVRTLDVDRSGVRRDLTIPGIRRTVNIKEMDTLGWLSPVSMIQC